ncbi:CLUMA_CG003240, isoform A [Clunio marinus]|uniref:Seipin n=1 Tax=Clunio marinus TaxID=568069 RepID=A0A1J1HNI4_9DIPT|nr:CLUMA_CG003240, isoform A [Clunio marinus]
MNDKRNGSSQYLQPTMFDFRLLKVMFNIFINIVDPLKIGRNFVFKPAVSAAKPIFEDFKSKAFKTFDGSQAVMLKLFAISIVGFLLFCGSILFYILFYLLYMPTSIHVKPVHMQYSKLCEDKSCDLESLTSPFHTFPMAHLQLNKNQLMMVGQPYHINVRLELPETPRNRDLGIFMICIDMKDKENSLKSQACRSTMLRYQSQWIQLIKNLFLIPLYVFNFGEEKQVIDIEMFSDYIDTTNSVTDVYIEIQSRVVEFYSVSLQLIAHFTGLRYLIYNFPLISALIGIVSIFIVLAVITLLLWYHYDYELDWVDEARRKITRNSKSFDSLRKESSSISAFDENLSVIEYNDSDKIADDDFMFDSDYERKQTNFEE